MLLFLSGKPDIAGKFMMKLQEQPFQDLPASEQAPMVEHVIVTTRKVQPENSSILLPTLLSYVLSVGAGFLIVYLVNSIFGSPYNQGLIQFESSLWRVGIPLSIVSSFLLGVVLPILFTRRKRARVVMLTLIMQFVTLGVIVIVGLQQLSSVS